jgi:predicted transcriptional regulator
MSEVDLKFDAPPTVAEVRAWRRAVRQGTVVVRDKVRADVLRWLDEEEARLLRGPST